MQFFLICLIRCNFSKTGYELMDNMGSLVLKNYIFKLKNIGKQYDPKSSSAEDTEVSVIKWY